MLLATLLACALPGPKPEESLGIDADAHASVATGGDDCDDTRPDVHPGAGEVCDDADLDEDCDGDGTGEPTYLCDRV